MLPNAIQLVAASARTPVGLAAEGVAASLRAGLSRVRLSRAPALDDGSDWFFALDGLLDPAQTDGAARIAEMGRSTLSDALARVRQQYPGLDSEIAEIPVVVALPEERPGWMAREIDRVRIALATVGAPGVRIRLELRPQGHAAVLAALEEALRLLMENRIKIAVVGGVDSYHDPETLAWLRENQQWLGEDSRSAFAPGEGAAFVALMRRGEGKRFNAMDGPSLLGVGMASEARLIKTDETCLGEGLTSAVRQAIAGLQSEKEVVDDVYCDINGERYRAEEWGFVALRLGAAFRDATVYRTPVQGCGDLGAATGAVNIVRCMQAWRRGYAKGPRALVWGSSEGGLRAAALLAAPKDES
jgi:3-oxoacyl-[acyl-carrier-protein] synthase-1